MPKTSKKVPPTAEVGLAVRPELVEGQITNYETVSLVGEGWGEEGNEMEGGNPTLSLT